MPFFLIPIAIALASTVAAGVGIKKGKDAYDLIQSAKRRAARSRKKHEDACSELELRRSESQKIAEEYARFQTILLESVVLRMVNFMHKYSMSASENDRLILENIGVNFRQVDGEFQIKWDASNLALDALKAAGASTAAYSGITAVASGLGMASTGAAISGLSGAAATNATLAWLGGGALAAGGGGVALGTAILSGAAFAPALLIGSFVLSSKAEEAETSSVKYAKQVDKAVAEMLTVRQYLNKLDDRVLEIAEVLSCLELRATSELDGLESLKFDKSKKPHVEKFRSAMVLVSAIGEILSTPVLDDSGEITNSSERICIKYSKYKKVVA